MLTLSLIFTFINIVLGNKSGMSVSASFTTPIIFYMLFKLIRLPDKTQFPSIQMFTSGASLAMFGIEIAFASILIFSGEFPIYKVLIVSVLVNIFSILFSIPLMGSLEEKTYIFPKGKITVNLINMAYATKEKGKDLLQLIVSTLVGAAISLFVMFKSVFRYPLTALGLPS
jgi:OPT oligopeptide transporter protein.